MSKKRFTPEQTIGILLCSDAVQAGDETIWQNCGLLL